VLSRRAESLGIHSARLFELTTRGRPQTRRLNPAGFSFAFALRGMLTLLLEPMLLERARKSGGPPPLEPSFKVKRDVHNQHSGFVGRPRC
jgi:hypothetical protein